MTAITNGAQATLLPNVDGGRHPLHAPERTWTEINCYVDLWIELLHAWGLDPRPASVCALSAGFVDDQWTFLKHHPEDLRRLYGIEVGELTVWRPVLDHVEEHLGRGRLLTVEVDAWWLPDTAGTTYRTQHDKTTIVPARLDRAGRTLSYFHNAGVFELEGDDFDGVFAEQPLAPYVEVIRAERMAPAADVFTVTHQLVGEHLRRRPPDNPLEALAQRVEADSAWLATRDAETFHRYAFAMLRQCGGTAALAADLVAWLGGSGGTGLEQAEAAFTAVSEQAKVVQFQLARVARGRRVGLRPALEPMIEGWRTGIEQVVAWYDR
ncbi:MAG TPA: DUF1839 family protein [Angustibacter sp.]|nr:DUF1839 family protein [Angustibacter sp.]